MATLAEQPKIEIGRVIGRGVEALARNWAAFLGVSVLCVGAPTLTSSYLTSAEWLEAAPLGWITWGLTWPLLWMILNAFAQAILARVVILDLSGRPRDLAGSALIALRLLPALIAMSILSGIGLLFAFALLIIPGIILYLAWIVAVPAMVEERIGPIAALSRSADLTSGSKGRIFVLALIWFAFWMVLSMGWLGVFGLAEATTAFDLFASVTEALVSTVSTMVTCAVTAALYLELRTVREGASVDHLAAIFE